MTESTGFTVVPQNVRIDLPNGESIDIPNVTLVAWKSALRLESKGIRVSRGRSVSAIVKSTLGLKKSLPVSKVLDTVVDLLNQYNTNVYPANTNIMNRL